MTSLGHTQRCHKGKGRAALGYATHHPHTITDTAQLASLINVTEHALGFGTAKAHIDKEVEKAVTNYVAALGTGLRPDLQPSRELTLTQPLHVIAIDRLMRNADEPTKQRLNSLVTLIHRAAANNDTKANLSLD